MNLTTIRKNAFTKITSLCSNAVGTLLCSSEYDSISGCRTPNYSESSVVEAISWLKENQQNAQVMMEESIEDYRMTKKLRIGSVSCTGVSFTIYFDELHFDGDRNHYLEATAHKSAMHHAANLRAVGKPTLSVVK